MTLNMFEPKLPRQEASRAANESSGNNISDKVPISDDESGCPNAKEDDKDGQCAGLKPNHGDRKRSRHHHMAGGKAAVPIALEEIEYMAWDPVRKHGWILASENEL